MALKNAKKPLTCNLFVLSAGMICCGLISVMLGSDLSWDIANYHFYNPYAFLYHRENIDLWPSSYIHQYINPTIDFPTYFLIKKFPPLLSQFILGAVHGINIWLLYAINMQLIAKDFKQITALVLAFIGIDGPTVLPGIGTFFNDCLISLFVLGHVLLMLIILQRQKLVHDISKHQSIWAGILLGMGIGLKLTAGIYFIGSLAASLLTQLPIRYKYKLFFYYGIGFLIGYLLFAGYWMQIMWVKYHNPLFPFLNNIFHSPNFEAINWRDTRFIPSNFFDTIFFPFLFSLDGRTADASFVDFRFSAVYGLFILAGIKWLAQRFCNYKRRANSQLRWLLIFFVSSYIIWQFYFSIARYLASLEMLAPLIIYLLLKEIIINPKIRILSTVGIFIIIVVFIQPTIAIRAPWYQASFFNIRLPTLVNKIEQANVLIAAPMYVMSAEPRPLTYLIPFFPEKWQFIGIPFLNERYTSNIEFENKVFAKISQKTTPIFLLTTDYHLSAFYNVTSYFHLQPAGFCHQVASNRQTISNQIAWLCPLNIK